jgi:hypothetical protein
MLDELSKSDEVRVYGLLRTYKVHNECGSADLLFRWFV